MRQRLQIWLLLLGLVGLASLWVPAQGQYYIDLEGAGETKGSYASDSVVLSGLKWDLTDVLIGTTENDWKNGARSVRMRGYATSGMTMLAPKINGLGTISFSYRRYGTDAQVDWKVEVSSNGGSDWAAVGPVFTAPAADDVQQFSATGNVAGDVRIRIKRATEEGASNKRVNIDDITMTDYIDPGTSLDWNRSGAWMVYPTRVGQELHIRTTAPVALVELVNLNGQVVMRATHLDQSGNEVVLMMNNQPKGIYLVKITEASGRIKMAKVVKE